MNDYKLLYGCIDYSVKKEKVDETADEKGFLPGKIILILSMW